MDQSLSPEVPDPSVRGALPWYHWRRWGFNFLTISILVHLLFGVGATYLIVQTFSKRKQTFAAQSAGPIAPTRALEHQVQMQKKQETMSAPAAVKRIVTISNTKIALPAMPPVFNADAQVMPLAMAGMGGSGVGLGPGGGGGGGNGNGGGGGMNFFGVHNGQGLVGTFYDLKQTRDRRPTGMTTQRWAAAVSQFVAGGWNVGQLAPYFKGPQPIYAQRIFIPSLASSQGPAAFGVQKEVQGSLWVVHYKGTVSPTESGTYHFAGGGDDLLMVRFNGRMVLARNWDNESLGVVKTNWRPQANYNFHYPPGSLNIPNGFAKGEAIEVTAGETCNMEVLIGDESPPYCFAALLIAKDGDEYEKDGAGNPLFPVFQLTRGALPPPMEGSVYAPHAEKPGPLWRAVAPSASSF